MKTANFLTICILLLSNAVWAVSTEDIFYAEVVSYDCQDNRRVSNLKGTCLITVKNLENSKNEIVGLVMSVDMYWNGGKYIQVGSEVRVDLTYTQDRTPYLRSYFPRSVSKVFFHDINNSYGNYSDVIEVQRRN